jgi:hypothetical protein
MPQYESAAARNPSVDRSQKGLATPATNLDDMEGNSQERTGNQVAGRLPRLCARRAINARACAIPCKTSAAVITILTVSADIFRKVTLREV